FRCLPNMIVSAPMNESELRNLMYTAQLPREGKAFSIRYPRGQDVMRDWRTPFEEIPVGRGRTLREGSGVAILSIGHVGNYAARVCERLAEKDVHIGHYDMRFAKPLDEELLHKICRTYNSIITVEDGSIQGGFGSAVLEFMSDRKSTRLNSSH